MPLTGLLTQTIHYSCSAWNNFPVWDLRASNTQCSSSYPRAEPLRQILAGEFNFFTSHADGKHGLGVHHCAPQNNDLPKDTLASQHKLCWTTAVVPMLGTNPALGVGKNTGFLQGAKATRGQPSVNLTSNFW